MAAYVIVGVDVRNPADYATYAKEVPGTLAPFGGEFVVRGGAYEVIEGAFAAPRIVVIRFPNVEQAKAWYGSPSYRAILPIREQHAETSFLLVVEGTA